MDDQNKPQTVKDPREMIAGMSPVMQPGLFAFCSIFYNADSREALAQAHGMIIEDEGMSLILPRAEAVRLGLSFDQPLKQITLMVYSALDGVGLTAAVATALAKHGIPANVVAGTMHDHIFVSSRQADAAIEVLRALQKEAQAELR